MRRRFSYPASAAGVMQCLCDRHGVAPAQKETHAKAYPMHRHRILFAERDTHCTLLLSPSPLTSLQACVTFTLCCCVKGRWIRMSSLRPLVLKRALYTTTRLFSTRSNIRIVWLQDYGQGMIIHGEKIACYARRKRKVVQPPSSPCIAC